MGKLKLAVLPLFLVLPLVAQVGPPIPPAFLTQKAATWQKPNNATQWTDVIGNPEILSEIEFAVARVPDDLNVSGVTPIVTQKQAYGGTDSASVAALVNGLPSGMYTIWGRVYDLAKNVSTWTRGNDFQYDETLPAPMINLIVK